MNYGTVQKFEQLLRIDFMSVHETLVLLHALCETITATCLFKHRVLYQHRLCLQFSVIIAG